MNSLKITQQTRCKLNQLKSQCLLAICMSLMLITQTSHADLRKALEAYQARDGVTMLKEVKDAVDSKNDDGLILFLSMLERDSIFSQNSIYVLNDEPINQRKMIEKTMGQYYAYDIPWLKALPHGKAEEFIALLQKATEKSSLESQFLLINLRSPYGIFDMLNYDEIERIQVNKRIESNIYRKQLPALSDKGYKQILYFLTEFGYTSKEEKETRQQKMLGASNTRGLLLQAANILTTNLNNRTEAQGLRLMNSALSKPDASYFYADIASKMSDYYLKKGDKKSLKQAYLWALVELTFGEPVYNHNNYKPVKSLTELKRADGLKKLGLLELDAIWNKNAPNQDWAYENLPNELKGLQKIEFPELILKNQTVNLNIQPILSFHRFNYNDQAVPLGLTAKNYLIDVYANGHVKVAVGVSFDRTQNQETLIILSPKELKQLLEEFDKLGIDKIPLNTLTNKNCGLGGCSEDYSRSSGFSSTYYITKRDKSNQRTVIYYLLDIVEDPPPFLAKVFTLLESRLNTQQYRCGSVKGRVYYNLCINFDKKTIEIANHGDAK